MSIVDVDGDGRGTDRELITRVVRRSHHRVTTVVRYGRIRPCMSCAATTWIIGK